MVGLTVDVSMVVTVVLAFGFVINAESSVTEVVDSMSELDLLELVVGVVL
jgi:hypothetical protein